MDESYNSSSSEDDIAEEPIEDEQPIASTSTGLTLVIPALSSLKKQKAGKKTKGKAKGRNRTQSQSTGLDGMSPAPKVFRPQKLKPLKEVLSKLIAQIKKKDDYAFFLSPVDPDKFPGYTDAIKRPMDLGTMTVKVGRGKYRSLEDFASDIRLITHNCRVFNPPGTIYHSEADRIEAWSLDHIAKAAPYVIEYETNWNIEIDGDEEGTMNPADDQEDYRPTAMEADSVRQSPALTTQVQPGTLRRGPRGPYKKGDKPTVATAVVKDDVKKIDNAIDEFGHLPGAKDGLGAFPACSDWANMVLHLKLKGKRYKTKKERLRMEKIGGRPYRNDGSLDYTEMEDPFTVLESMVPETLSKPVLTPLYPTSAVPESLLESSPPPQPTTVLLPTSISNAASHTLASVLSTRPTTPPPAAADLKKKRQHWTIVRNAPARKFKDKEDEEAPAGPDYASREPHTSDWGTLAVLSDVLKAEMDRRAKIHGFPPQTEEFLQDTLRASVESMQPPISETSSEQPPQHFTPRKGKAAEVYLQDLIYGGVDGYSYARSLAEFVQPQDGAIQVQPESSSLGATLALWVEANILDPITGGRHSILRDVSLFLTNPRFDSISKPFVRLVHQSLNEYPAATAEIAALFQIQHEQIDMGPLIKAPDELVGSEEVWEGQKWRKRRADDLTAAKTDAQPIVGSDPMTYEGSDMLQHVLEFTAGLLRELNDSTQAASKAKEGSESVKQESEANAGDHMQVDKDGDERLLGLRLNLLALTKRAPLDKIAKLPADLVPEHIRHFVPTLG